MDNLEKRVLQHVGVLGMKWGHRKDSSSSASSRISVSGLKGKTKGKLDDPDVSEDYKKVASLRKKKAKHLSNSEMQAVITRLQLEKSFNEAQRSGGEKFVKELLVNQGKQDAAKFVATNLPKALKWASKNLI